MVNRGAGWGCGREVACIWPGTEKAGPLSAASTSGPREGPGPLVGPVHTAPTWGQATPRPQDAGLWARPGRGHCLPPAHTPTPSAHPRVPLLPMPTLWRRKRSCLGRAVTGQGVQEVRGQGRLPSPVTGTNLIYLFWLKKQKQKQLGIAFGLTHKRSYPQAVCVWFCYPPTPPPPSCRGSSLSLHGPVSQVQIVPSGPSLDPRLVGLLPDEFVPLDNLCRGTSHVCRTPGARCPLLTRAPPSWAHSTPSSASWGVSRFQH